MTENERKNLIIMMKQLESHGLLYDFIASLTNGKHETKLGNELFKKTVQDYLDCVNELELIGQKGVTIKKMLINAINDDDNKDNNDK
jgi:hypothetical protein